VHELLRIHVELIEDVRAFRYLDGRDLNGFVLAEDNPRGPERREVAVVGDYDEAFAGGSYVHVQRFRHDLQKWQFLSDKRQEQIIGRTKEHNLASNESNLSSHYTRTRMTDLAGVEKHARMLRQSMPYANMQVQGEYFVSCCHSPRPFKAMLHSMYYGASDGEYDAWLDYTNAETGGAFFAPSIDFIQEQAQRD
jgi:putative iron-dependent peroxidase